MIRNNDILSALNPPSGYIPMSGGFYVPSMGKYFPYVAGGDRGFNDTDQLMRTLDGVTFPTVWTDLQNSLAAYNRVSNELMGRLCYRTTQTGLREFTPGSMRFERGTEFGRPDRQRHGAFRMRGLPVWKYQIGVGFTRDFLLGSRRAEIDAQHTEVMRADLQNLLFEMLAAVFNDDNYNFDDEQAGPVNVKALYNGDGEEPPAFEGQTFNGTHTHYHPTVGIALAHDDILTMKRDLTEHGHDGNRVLLAAANVEQDIRDMANVAGDPVFYANLNGPDYQFIELGPGSTEDRSRVSNDYIGVVEGFQVRILNWLPDNYLFGYQSYGENSPMNPFGLREKTNALQRGLQLINENPDSTYPIVNSFYERWFGVGVVNRSNGTVMFVDTANTGSYAEPDFSGSQAT